MTLLLTLLVLLATVGALGGLAALVRRDPLGGVHTGVALRRPPLPAHRR